MIDEQQTIAQELDQWIKQLKCSGSTGIEIESFKDIKVGVDPSKVKEGCVSYDPITDADTKKAVNRKTEVNSKESIKIELEKGDAVEGFFKDGLRHGQCQLYFIDQNVREITGEYKYGKIDGKAKVTFKDKSTIVGYFKTGILHGFTRYFDKRGS